jgi:hypothetical protein
MTKNGNKFAAGKKMNVFFYSKIVIYLSVGLDKGCPGCRRCLQLSKENIQHLKTWNFFIFFSVLVGHFCPPGPDPADQNQYESMRSRVQRIWLFLEIKDTDPLMGAKLKSKTHLLNTFFDFLSRFLRVCLQSLKKVLIWPLKKNFVKKIEKGVKKRRISRWFRIRWKSCKKMHTKKVMSKTSLTNMSKSGKSALTPFSIFSKKIF